MRFLALVVPALVFTACPDGSAGGDDAGPGGDEGEGDTGGEEGEGEGEGEERVDAGPEPDPDVAGLDARPTNTTCVAPDRPVENSDVVLTQVFPNLALRAPLFLLERPGDSENFYAIERAGRVVRWPKNDDNATTPEVFCDIRDRVETSDSGNSEQGLLGITFHPDNDDELYLSYTAENDNDECSLEGASCPFESRLSRFTIDDDGCDAGSEVILLDIDDFAANHNGGHIVFGPDGTLYFGMGDGGFADDPLRAGQDMSTLLGKLIRIDVDRAENGKQYGIPADNPFRDTAGALPEIYALGLRNPWRFSFDRGSGDLWLGDVGQNRIEEIDLVEAGGNYGWSVFEGNDCFAGGNSNPVGCNDGGFAPPVITYSHQNGRFSVTGGYVYRGSAIPDLVGTYLFADFASKEVFALGHDTAGNANFTTIATMAGGGVASFAEDSAGELYLVDLAGQLFRFDPAGPPVEDTFPRRLSETGCMDSADTTRLGDNVIPYQLNHPFYSDGASKQRGVGIPDGATATIGEDGDIEMPVGTVFIKSFELDDRLIETRLMVRHDDGEWAGYTYEWNEDGTDAVLVESGGKTKRVGDQTWSYPSRAGCLVCHTAAAGRDLGWEVGQLNGGFTYPQTGRLANQLFTLSEIGVFSNPPADVAAEAAYPAPDLASVDVGERAKTYLHVNCSMCHRPGGGGQSPADLRLSTPLAAQNVCGAAPSQGDLGVAGAQVLFPGDPARSMISLRMKRLGAGRMPPLGSNVVDALGTDVVDRYIASLEGCP